MTRPIEIDNGLHVVDQDPGMEKCATIHGASRAVGPLVDPHVEFEAALARSNAENAAAHRSFRSRLLALSALAIFLLAAVVTMAGVFGSRIVALQSQRSATEPAAGFGPTATGTALAGWTYQGCYVDGDKRALSGPSQSSNAMTNRQCASFCFGFGYFGTQFGSQCYCGNETSFAQAGAWNCNMQCAGAVGGPEICGGTYFLSLWKSA